MIRQRSRSRLKSDARSSTDVVPPLPSPDRATYSLGTRWPGRRKQRALPSPPPVPPLPSEENGMNVEMNMKIALSDILNMDGIVDTSALSQSHDGSSLAETSYRSSTESHSSPSQMFRNPFADSAAGPSTVKERSGRYDGRNISPKTVAISKVDASGVPEDDKTQWVAPQSWAVENPGDDSMLADYSSSDESVRGPGPSSRMSTIMRSGSAHCNTNSGATSSNHKPRHSKRKQQSQSKSSSSSYKLRVYRAAGAWHVVTIDLGVTVEELTPVLNEKLLTKPDVEIHRLYLKERGRGNGHT